MALLAGFKERQQAPSKAFCPWRLCDALCIGVVDTWEMSAMRWVWLDTPSSFAPYLLFAEPLPTPHHTTQVCT
jgi:hypothetical protein